MKFANILHKNMIFYVRNMHQNMIFALSELHKKHTFSHSTVTYITLGRLGLPDRLPFSLP